MTDRFHDEVSNVFADIEAQTPPAPHWDDMTTGFAKLASAAPVPTWRKPIALIAAAVATVAVVGVAMVFASLLDTGPSPVPATSPPATTTTVDDGSATESSTTTTDPVTTSSSPTTTTPATEARCSAERGLVVPSYDAADPNSLSAEAVALRDNLVDLAMACDFAGLVALSVEAALVNPDDLIFWGAAQSTDALADHDAQYDSLAKLAVALTELPFSVEQWEPTPDEVEVFYVWPPVTRYDSDESLADFWDEDLLAIVAALNGVTVEDLIADSDAGGAYDRFRIAITETGRWMFAFVGD